MIEAHVVNSAYMNNVYVVWEIPWHAVKYILYRNDEIIAETPEEITEETPNPFERPTIFDHDHHTELFKPGSRNLLCYVDNDIRRYVTYKYQLKVIYDNEQEEFSDELMITTQ